MNLSGTSFKTQEEADEFCKIMDGMEEVNAEMVKKMEEANPPPMCHFTQMEWDEGIWICKHCGHTEEDEAFYNECNGYGY
jgi:ribosomal protein L37AE/L43A